MSDEIYVNTGTSFQQPFNDRTPLIVNTAVTAQRVAQAATNTQQPYPYIANAQTTYQASAQQPYPYTANRTISYPYIANAQTPYIANNQTPFPYIANGQQPYIAAAQQPYPYTANSQTPYIANGQQPYPYTAAGQQPYIANAQQAYSYTANAQTSYTADGQQPYPYIANQPITYPYIGQGRQPSTYQHQEPGTYTRQGQTPYPYIANQPTTYPYIASAQTTYQANAQQPYPYTANAQTAYTANGQQPYPYTANAQTPSIANAQQPYPYTATSQTPYIASAQQPYPYIANGSAAVSSRTPYVYTDTTQSYLSGSGGEVDEGGMAITVSGYLSVKYVSNDIVGYYYSDGNDYANVSTGAQNTGTTATASSATEVFRIRDCPAGYSVTPSIAYWPTFTTYNTGDGTTGFFGTLTAGTTTAVTTTDGTHRVRKNIIGTNGSGASYVRATYSFTKTSNTTYNFVFDHFLEVELSEVDCSECCVHESMLIATGEDMKSIHDIKIGDSVVSYNFETGENELVEVEDLITIERDVDYKVNNLILTEDHPVYLETGKKASVSPSATLTNYKQEVDQIKVGDVMVKLDGTTEEITSIERYEGTHLNYAIKTKHNNFYADGILVDSVIQGKG
tara:strand:+ start:315 stop:2177 length:1863 start_codon:yes stop_codon:yes gene_type:complete